MTDLEFMQKSTASITEFFMTELKGEFDDTTLTAIFKNPNAKEGIQKIVVAIKEEWFDKSEYSDKNQKDKERE